MRDGTSLAGEWSQSPAQFSTTHWTVVLAAGQPGSPQAAVALEALCRTYWLPVYAFVRRRGYSPEDAQDLTQAFLAELIARRDLSGVSPDRGRFRSFLLACLDHFMNKDWRSRCALKRGGGQTLIPLHVALAEERLGITADSCHGSPEHWFDQKWAHTVMERALAKLREEMVAGGKSALFEELKGLLTEVPGAGSYVQAGFRLGMKAEAVATAVHRLRRRYRELVRATLADTVTTPLELEEEMNYLLEVLSQ